MNFLHKQFQICLLFLIKTNKVINKTKEIEIGWQIADSDTWYFGPILTVVVSSKKDLTNWQLDFDDTSKFNLWVLTWLKLYVC